MQNFEGRHIFMPELPDLEVFRGNIFKKISSKRLFGLEVFSQKIITPQSVLVDELVGCDLLCIGRIGKELIFDFGDERIITAHLMLNGGMSIVCNIAEADKIKSKVFSLNFENESLVFHDRGHIGTVIKYKPIQSKTPDALGENFTLDYFLKIAKRKSSANIKAFLIDQKVVRGIGNAYVDEILWSARISPKSIVGAVSEDVLANLYETIKAVLHEAIISIKAISPDIISGEERSFLKVHTKLKKETDTGYPIIIEQIASKKTYFTEEQVVYL